MSNDTSGMQRTFRWLANSGEIPSDDFSHYVARMMRRDERFLHDHPEIAVQTLLKGHLTLCALLMEELAHQKKQPWGVDALLAEFGPHIHYMARFPPPPREALAKKEETRDEG